MYQGHLTDKRSGYNVGNQRIMKYNSAIHHRRSIRFKGYYYSQARMYFITICTQDSLQLFGKITNDEMVLNDSGMMIGKHIRMILIL